MKIKQWMGPLFFVFCLSVSAEALAFPKVYSPIVNKGEVELEYKISADFDHRDGFKNSGEQDFELGYGLTDRWFAEVEAELDREPRGLNEDTGEEENHPYEYGATSIENVFQLTEQGQYFVDLGLFFEYGWASHHEDTDHIETKILLEKQWGDFIHRLNVGFEKETGGGEKEGLNPGFSWQTLYRLRQEFEPGFEIHSEFGPAKEQGPYQEQEHMIGPVVEGRIFRNLKYNVGYLFGISDAAPAGELKCNLEWEQQF